MEFADSSMERRIGNPWRHDVIMTVGTELLVKIFETFAEHQTHNRTFRRLFCESGQAAIKAYRYSNESTQKVLDAIIPKCKYCKHHKLQTRTIVMAFGNVHPFSLFGE